MTDQDGGKVVSLDVLREALAAIDDRLLPHAAWVRKTARELLDYKRKLAQADDYLPTRKPTNSERWPRIGKRYAIAGGDTEEFDSLSVAQLIRLGVPAEVFKEQLARTMWNDGGGADEDYDELPAEDKEALERSAVKQAKASLAFPD